MVKKYCEKFLDLLKRNNYVEDLNLDEASIIIVKTLFGHNYSLEKDCFLLKTKQQKHYSEYFDPMSENDVIKVSQILSKRGWQYFLDGCNEKEGVHKITMVNYDKDNKIIAMSTATSIYEEEAFTLALAQACLGGIPYFKNKPF